MPVESIPETTELRTRAEALEAYRRERNGPGTVGIVGDAKKGGRRATPEESLRLREPQAGGVPAGLARCPTCGEWKGECLDTQPREVPWVVRVHCQCENQNRCAGCGRLLCERKLNSNQYDEADGKIWHYGGATALAHGC